MRRREFIAGLGSTAAWSAAARAQQREPMRRVGVLVPLSATDPEQMLRIAAFLAKLRELGWIEGRNVQFTYRYGANNPERRRAYATELVALKPDAILANTTQVLPALQEATHSVPIVFTMVADPLATGVVRSLSRPGGNVTGFATTEDPTSGKLLQILKELNGAIARVLVISDRSDPSHEKRLIALDAASVALDVQLKKSDAQNAAEIERAIDAFAVGPDSGAVVLPSSATAANRDLIALMMARRRLPAIYAYRYFATSGGLISYGIDTIDLHRSAATYVDLILRGQSPGDLPVQQPTKLELVINLKAAKAIGLEVPATLLLRADTVIE